MVEAQQTQIVVVDDHPLYRAGLVAALRREADLEVLAEAGGYDEALELAKVMAIDLAIVDVLMPSVSGISLATELIDLQPSCKVLALSVVDEPTLIADMLRTGASGFALKTQPTEAIIEAIRLVLGGIRYLPPNVSRDAIERELVGTPHRPLQRLTRREREVFEMLIRGHSNDEIAIRFFIARRTVETHRQRIMKKLSAHSIVEMLRVVARHGGLDG